MVQARVVAEALAGQLGPQRVVFIRHGQTDYNVERRAQGQKDTPLNSTGLSQARAVKLEVGQDTAVFSSPLQRALITASIIFGPSVDKPFQARQITLLSDLMERGFGQFEGQLFKDIDGQLNQALSPATTDTTDTKQDKKSVFIRDLSSLDLERPPETRPAFQARVQRAWEAIRCKGGKEVVVVAHGGVWKQFAHQLGLHLQGPIKSISNATPQVLEKGKDGHYFLK